MALNIQVFTNNGINMLGQADAGQTLTVTRIVVGAGSASQDSDLYPLTQLISWKDDVTINRKQDLGGGVMLVSGVLNEWEMPAGQPFQLRELGIMAYTTAIGGTGQPPPPAPPPPLTGPAPAPTISDSLYCVSNVYAATPQTITPGGTKSWAFDIQVEIDRATSVIIQIGTASTYDCENVPTDDTVDPGWYAGRLGNVFQFKRAVAGLGIILDQTTYSDRIIIKTAQLVQNIDLYVPANNPDAPANPPPNTVFATIQAAHDYLLQFTIPPQYHATIHVHELNHAVISTGAINFTHPNSSQINVIGEAPVSITITSITPGTAGAKVCHVPSTTGLAVGQFVAILDSYWGYGGGCYITALGTGTVTVNTWDQGGQPVYAKTDPGGRTQPPRLVYLPTVLKMSTTPSVITGMLNCPYGIGLFQNICAIGDPRPVAPSNNLMNYVTYIFSVGGIGGSFTNCWAMCGRRGFNLYAGTAILSCDHPWPYVGAIVSSNCAFGIIGSGVVAAFDRTYVNGCVAGIMPSGAGYAIGSITGGMDYTIVYLNHNYTGVQNASGLFLGGSYVYTNNGVAFQAQTRGTITLDTVYPSAPEYNGILDTNGKDLIATGSSYIWYDRHGQAAPVTVPVHDSVASGDLASSQLSFIHVQDSGAGPGGGPIGPNGPQEGGFPVGPQTPVIGPPGPGTPPGNFPYTPPTTPAIPPLLPTMPLSA
jgi:hypothetical protein